MNVHLQGDVQWPFYCLIKEAGKLAVLGSCHMFSDQYIEKEENGKIMVRSDLVRS